MKIQENVGMQGEWDFFIAEKPTPMTRKEVLRYLDLKRACERVAQAVPEMIMGYRVRHVHEHNIIPTVSRQQICKALAGSISTVTEIKITHQALGTGTTAPANGDTNLETISAPTKIAVASLAYSSNQLNITAFWAAAAATGTWREFGTFINTTVLFNRAAINITISASESLTIDGTITIS